MRTNYALLRVTMIASVILPQVCSLILPAYTTYVVSLVLVRVGMYRVVEKFSDTFSSGLFYTQFLLYLGICFRHQNVGKFIGS